MTFPSRAKVVHLAKLLSRTERTVYYWLENRRIPRLTLREIKNLLENLQLQKPEDFPESIQEILDLISDND